MVNANSNNDVRPSAVLRLRAFLSMDGSDGMSINIAGMKKTEQLAKALATCEKPEDGWTHSELALAFYGQTKDFNKMKKLEQNDELAKWNPSYQQGTRMNQLIYNFRKRVIRKKGAPHYSFPVELDEFDGQSKNILIPIETAQQFAKVIKRLRNRAEGCYKRIEQLDDIMMVKTTAKAKSKTQSKVSKSTGVNNSKRKRSEQ